MVNSIHNLLYNEQSKLNEELAKYIHTLETPFRLKKAILYSLQAGGKRLRPLLMKLTCTGLGGEAERIYPAALALEMIHTYSLIHDDLPAMDNDTYRRGQLTNHLQFDEATAILAGDGLLTNSFHLISSSKEYTSEEKVQIITRLSAASGLEGMVAGQYLDMEAENSQVSASELEQIHRLKTGQLISFAIETGGLLAKSSMKTQNKLKKLGEYLGLIFQIQDDILDVEGDQQLLGKKVGSDIHNEKSTYPSLLGLEGARKHKHNYLQKARYLLKELHLENTKLEKLTNYVSERTQ